MGEVIDFPKVEVVYCHTCGTPVRWDDLRMVTYTVNDHPGTCVVCKPCFDRWASKR